MRFLILVSLLATSLFSFADDSTSAPVNTENAIALNKINEIKETRLACLEKIEGSDEVAHAKCLDASRLPLEDVLLGLINARLVKVKSPIEAGTWASTYLDFKLKRIATVTKLRDDNLGSVDVKSIMYTKHIELTENKLMSLIESTN